MKTLIELVRTIKRKIEKGLIRDDYLTAVRCKLYLQVHEDKNFEVAEGKYLTPKTTGLSLPLRHPDGLFKYYEALADELAIILANGCPGIRIIQSNPPHYVSEFAGH